MDPMNISYIDAEQINWTNNFIIKSVGGSHIKEFANDGFMLTS